MHEQILKMYEGGMGTTSIGKKLKIPYNRVRNIIIKHGKLREQFRYKNPEPNTEFEYFIYLKTIYINNKKRWLCKCKACGYELKCKPNHIITKWIKSCGCLKNYRNKERIIYSNYGYVSGYYFRQLEKGALKRDLEFNITIEYINELYISQNFRCALTKIPIEQNQYKEKKENMASLDRINNNKGYIVGNVRWVLKEVNQMKSNIDEDKFLSLCILISNNIGTKND